MPGVYLPTNTPLNGGGATDQTWLAFFRDSAGAVAALQTVVNALLGVNVFTVATQPTLAAGDAGYLGWLSDYKHVVRWTGSAWEFFGDSSNGFFADFAIVPQAGSWQLCDGTTTTYLTLGATLTETSFATPNLTGSPAYKKTAGAYTGTIAAKSGATDSGTTDASGAGTAIAHTTTPVIVDTNGGGATVTVSGFTSGNVIDNGVQTHGVPGLGVGSIDMAHLDVLPYFRR